MNLAAAEIKGCSAHDDIWLKMIHAAHPTAQEFIDIGSNKGYSSAAFFSIWSAGFGLTAPRWHAQILAASSFPDAIKCGICKDCQESAAPILDPVARLCVGARPSDVCARGAARLRPPRVRSFDGNPHLVEATRAAAARLNETFPGALRPAREIAERWSFELGGMTAQCAPGEQLTFLARSERGHLALDGTASRDGEEIVRVPCMTVDGVVARNRIAHVDLLKIDTEGNDPAVLKGAARTLARGGISFLDFEYHGLWAPTRDGRPHLQVVAEELARDGYVCYLAGERALVRITGCWHDAIHKRRGWSNVFCASGRRPEGRQVIAVFDAASIAFMA